jgi:hypothetical protein
MERLGISSTLSFLGQNQETSTESRMNDDQLAKIAKDGKPSFQNIVLDNNIKEEQAHWIRYRT